MPKRIKATVLHTITISEDDFVTVAQGLAEAAKSCKSRASVLRDAGLGDAATVYENAAKGYSSLARAFALAGQ
jgi:hypothetical protein